MSTIEKSIEIHAPLTTVYNQWTQFEDFKEFMDHVELQQVDDQHLRCRTQFFGREKEWETEIIEQIPDRQILWHNTSGIWTVGLIRFEVIGLKKTRLTFGMTYKPKGWFEIMGDILGFVSRRIEKELQRFKEFVETNGIETGAWRGTIHSQHRRRF